VDTTAPVVTIAGVVPDAAVGDSGVLRPTWSASDDSGIESVTATLDGEPVAASATVELWRLPLGAHTLVVTATDKAGVTGKQSVGFSTVTAFKDVAALVQQFHRAGKVTTAGAVILQAQLLEARLHASAGRTRLAVAALTRFGETAGNRRYVPDPARSAALRRDATALIEQVQH
jgi:hypothetical protein